MEAVGFFVAAAAMLLLSGCADDRSGEVAIDGNAPPDRPEIEQRYDPTEPHDKGWDEPIAGAEVLFRNLDLRCFLDKDGVSLHEHGYEIAEGRYGWNVPDTRCTFGDFYGFVEDFEVGNRIQFRVQGSRVTLRLGMDFFGDQVQMRLTDEATGAVTDLGWINTCANVDQEQKYDPRYLPEKRIPNPNEYGKIFSSKGRWVQSFVIADNLGQGTYLVELEHTWSKEIDPGKYDFNHLYSIVVD